MSATRSVRYGLLGLLQGGMIWALRDPGLIPADALAAATRETALALAFGVPLLVYLSGDGGWPARRRAAVVGLLGIWLLLTAWWQASTAAQVSGLWPQMDPAARLGLALLPPVALTLMLGWDTAGRRFDYARLFQLSWRNALLALVSALLLGLCWVTLWAGAMLLESIGLRGMRELISDSRFAWPASGAILGIAVAQALARAGALETLRRFWLGLNGWFYPLALAFGVAWLAALPFTGLDALHRTRHAAFMLLWFAVLGIKFCNAAWQDGREPSGYPRVLRTLLPWMQLCLIAVAAVAAHALFLRIDQHGLSIRRIWASWAALLVALYALGYALSLLPHWRRRGWMASVGSTNIATAIVGLCLAALLLSPLLDARSIAVRQQLARLDDGRVAPEHFDVQALALNHGRAGRDALQTLAQRQGTEQTTALARRAKQALTVAPVRMTRGLTADERTQAVQRLRLWPRELPLDPGFSAWFTQPDNQWRTDACLRNAPRCLLWRIDLDGDGQVEVLVLQPQALGTLDVYRRDANGWRTAGHYVLSAGGDFETLAARFEAGDIQPRPARMPDLSVDGRAMQFVGRN